MKKADLITLLRGLCALALLACPALSPAFYALYIAAWLSDVIDGAVARKTNTASERGARMDTAADLILVVVSFIKLLPALDPPLWLLLWTAGIAFIKALNFAFAYVMRKRFVALHTAMNKITGCLLFALPLTLPVLDPRISGTAVCAAATFAAVQEGHFIRTGRDVAQNTGKNGNPTERRLRTP